MDWDFLLRLSENQIKIQHLPVFLGLFRVHQNQKTSSKMSSIGQQEIQMIRRRELGYVPTRLQLILNMLPYFLSARLHEVGFMFDMNRNKHEA